MITPDFDIIEVEVAELIEANISKVDCQGIIKKLAAVKTECDKSLQHRVSVGKTGAYTVLLDTLSIYRGNKDVSKQCLKTLISLMRKQPDLLDARGVDAILSYLRKHIDNDLKKFTLKWAKECCFMHEMNRQMIFNANILHRLKPLLSSTTTGDVLKETLAVCRALVLDDDIRVEFGKAHEHARIIANETLCSLIGLLSRLYQDILVSDVIMTLTTLLIREEFCKKFENSGSLDTIKTVMVNFMSDEKVIKQCFRLLKALSGNDHCKNTIIEKEFAQVINVTLHANMANKWVATAGLHCIAALSLRCPQNSKALINAGLGEVIITIMKMHPDEEIVQKTASWAIRNMVSRNKTHGRAFIKLGVEELLLADLEKFENIEYDIKAALRDLNCNVRLKEEWTGQGGALTTGFNFSNIEWS